MKITALIHNCQADGESGFAARCVEFPEANGQGESIAEAMADLRSAVHAVIDYRRSEALGIVTESDHILEAAL